MYADNYLPELLSDLFLFVKLLESVQMLRTDLREISMPNSSSLAGAAPLPVGLSRIFAFFRLFSSSFILEFLPCFFEDVLNVGWLKKAGGAESLELGGLFDTQDIGKNLMSHFNTSSLDFELALID